MQKHQLRTRRRRPKRTTTARPLFRTGQSCLRNLSNGEGGGGGVCWKTMRVVCFFWDGKMICSFCGIVFSTEYNLTRKNWPLVRNGSL